MTRQEAFQVLGLPISATHEEINDQFRELARRYHPDAGGDADEMARVALAREIAIGSAAGTAVVPLDVVRDVVKIAMDAALVPLQRQAQLSHEANHRAERQFAEEQTRRVVAEIREHHTTPLKHQRRTAATIGAISAGLAVFVGQLLPTLRDVFGLSATVPLAFGVLSAALALSYWWINSQIQWLEDTISELNERLDEKNYLWTILTDVLEKGGLGDRAFAGATQGWTQQELRSAVAAWFELQAASAPANSRPIEEVYRMAKRMMSIDYPHVGTWRIAERIGVRDFASLLTRKALEHGLIREEEVTRPDVRDLPWYRSEYRVAVFRGNESSHSSQAEHSD